MQTTPGPLGKHPAGKTLKDCISYLRRKGIKIPIFCGIGVSTPNDVKQVIASGADVVMLKYIGNLKKATQQPEKTEKDKFDNLV